ncbi:MAG: DNA recombination protein RmuC [Candidatus Wildermuthbacteria bacterium]|nr:DNA recombination protein RmuC [Candidatus Wildermuthbacteria bacterium]
MSEILLIGIIALLAGIIVFLVLQKKGGAGGSEILMIQNQLQHLRATLDEKLGDSSKRMDETVRAQFGESQRAIRETSEQMIKHLTEVTKVVTEANEAGKQVFTIAEQLQNLEKVLKHQKQRGNLGEASLELILSNTLPTTVYKMQHHFVDGDIVDAIIITKEGIIPIDAKFSLDNYNRLINEPDELRKSDLEKEFKNDLKKRIDETAKYIKPKEGTLSFAFMFIPAEGIYYDLLINEVGSVKVNTRNLLDYAYNDKKVIIVSPTTFAAYLQSVLYGFKAFKIEESAKKMGEQVQQLMRNLGAYEQYFNSVGISLRTTVNHYTKASSEFRKIDKDILKITGSSNSIEMIEVPKPNQEED